MTTITITILSIIPILIICASLYITNRRVDKVAKATKKLYSGLQQHDLIINYVLADDIREIKEQIDAYKLELHPLHPYANDREGQA